MINSVNSIELLKSKLLTMDKYGSTNAKLLPPSSFTPTRTFDSLQEKLLLSNEITNQDRVKVQHLENHTKLQNNKCNTFRTLFKNISASSEVRDNEELLTHQIKDEPDIDVENVEHLKSTSKTPYKIQNNSAFNIDFKNKYLINNKSRENNNDVDNFNDSLGNETKKFYQPEYNYYGLINKNSGGTKMIVMAKGAQISTTDSQRNEDQDQAYRHIESVHNYAKSKSFEGDDYDKASASGSRNSSYLSDDEEEDDDNGDPDYDNDAHIDYEDRLPDDLDADYEDILNKRRYRKLQKLSSSITRSFSLDNKLVNKEGNLAALKKPPTFANILKHDKIQQHLKMNNIKIENTYEDEEDPVDVDVETVEPLLSPNTSAMDDPAVSAKPDHHARRPMNAFLIFCKRHRAIVKDRYKNLENRAITKILGDWWASLESSEKKCFTNLAQQNKDAFFSANPNFKWYKLPAPPLRTLSTRPANLFGQELLEENSTNGAEILTNTASYNHCSHSNYFKLADEAHMGDLSQLMDDKTKAVRHCADLQQALGETSQFMSRHITCNSEMLDEKHPKRRYYNENSVSSNSSEEDIMEPKKKNARTCKGKRYQELINSGQIATALKKPKPPARPIVGEAVANSETTTKQNCPNVCNLSHLISNDCQKRSLSESEGAVPYDINSFDLEEKIKELPALNLDDYLQRKRNTKKKKKFSANGKKRGQRTSNNKNNQIPASGADLPDKLIKQHQPQSTNVVGSQKRKARKESITRRDVSAIEQEVASLLPLTINGCCYFQEAPATVKLEKFDETDSPSQPQSHFLTPFSPIIPKQELAPSPPSADAFSNAHECTNNISNDNIPSTSTSDLLILAEVAANRTEFN